MKKHIFFLLFLLPLGLRAQGDATPEAATQQSLHADDRDHNLIQAALQGWHVSVGAGLNLGGTAPLPLPAEIRKINSFNPTLIFYLEGLAQKSFPTSRFGLALGVRLETKGMKTDARTKNYNMSISMDDQNDAGEYIRNTVGGRWTGNVVTKVNNKYLTFPLMATYTFRKQRWRVGLGPYFSVLLDGDFSGHVYDGYLRKDDPTGEKIEFAEGATASYDFSDEQRRFNWGLQAQGSFRAYRHFSVDVRLAWALNDTFKRSFKTITFPMYNIYGSLGISYEF